jgi:hypothetical protein
MRKLFWFATGATVITVAYARIKAMPPPGQCVDYVVTKAESAFNWLKGKTVGNPQEE